MAERTSPDDERDPQEQADVSKNDGEKEAPDEQQDDKDVEESAEDSFPASDPPAW